MDTSKIIINYNEDDLPVKVITTDSDTRIVIEYENKMIKQISKENDLTKTILQNFIYTNNVLTEVRDIEKELKKVVRLFRNKTNKWLHLKFKTKDTIEEIICTEEHPFFIPNKEYIKAKYLVEKEAI